MRAALACCNPFFLHMHMHMHVKWQRNFSHTEQEACLLFLHAFSFGALCTSWSMPFAKL